jgi:hypothetical protein
MCRSQGEPFFQLMSTALCRLDPPQSHQLPRVAGWGWGWGWGLGLGVGGWACLHHILCIETIASYAFEDVV